MHNHRPFVAFVMAMTWLITSNVRAQSSEPAGVSLDRYRPGLEAESLAGLELASRAQLGSYDLWLSFGYGGDFLVVADRSQNASGALVGPRLTSHLGGSIVVLPRLQLGVDVPLVLFQARRGTPPQAFGAVGDLAATGVGDLSLFGKLHLLEASRALVDAAALVGVSLPSHAPRDAYLGNEGVTASATLVVSRQLFGFELAGNLGYDWRKSTTFLDATIGPEVRLGLGASYDLQALTQLPLAAAAAWSLAARHNAPFKRLNETPAELLFEAQWRAWSPLIVSATAGVGLVAGVGTPDLRAGLLVRYAPRRADADHDAISDDIDACPKDAEDYDGFEDANGCPEPDNDGDGIDDTHDACPNAPETQNEFDDEDGCPDHGAAMQAGQILLSGNVHFEVGNAVLKPKSRLLLNEVAELLATHLELERIRIEGHTDNDGDADANQKLSQARADAVMAYLVSRGVAPERLVAKGFGETRPLATNATPKGRALNRRVEFVVEKTG
ncbi:MAG: OmpA family protein [Myxococcota bacterium]